MIDYVQRSLENMVPELEDYKKRQIFTDKEIEKIIETRRSFECKIHRSKKNLADFINYIDSEKNLEKIRKRRIIKKKLTSSETDNLLIKNIISIYERALHHFKEPFLVKDYTEFCIKKKFNENMKITLGKLCSKNVVDTDLWVYSAQKLWEINDLDGARAVFLKGTGVNKDIRLMIEFFRLECLYSHKINQINIEIGVEEEDMGDLEKGEVAFVIFKDIFLKASQVHIDECLKISEIVPFLHKKILEFLENNSRVS